MRAPALWFLILVALPVAACGGPAPEESGIPAKTVVLTFDDADKTHRTLVAPLLAELGFGATFFVTPRWIGEEGRCMTLTEIAELHRMGFEIGNHSLSHYDLSPPNIREILPLEVEGVEKGLETVGVPRPVSFSWPGDRFGPEVMRTLKDRGYLFARRGKVPEVATARLQPGLAYDPRIHHPHLVPSAGVVTPSWTEDYFRLVLEAAEPGKAVIIQFHGVPSRAYPQMSTDPGLFRRMMTILKDEGYRVVALRDLAPYVDRENLPDDPLAGTRYP